MIKRKPIYVETMIKGSIEDVWSYTQTPSIHERWDLRFSSISYLPKDGDVQPFLYQTNIGFGISVAGEGRSKGSKELKDGSKVSSLQFGSDTKISLIKEGSGFWKYEPQSDHVRFYTSYDYETRFGVVGSLIDKYLFRPLIGWATAWSFDALKRWIEDGIPPEQSIRRLLSNVLICLALCFIWIYQGLVPKILFPETGELQLLQQAGFFSGFEREMVFGIGLLEILIGILFLLPINKQPIFIATSLGVALLGLGAFFTDYTVFFQPFNPATLNIGMIILGLIGWLNGKDLPQGQHCVRRKL
ncbi:DoxX-like family protein [Evansella sp. AB-P1]|uniref:DoxX-like family protein n=1 Tax=Evansella sp. AB-P1 TaxID=3037653 RepID=UPI00241F04E8|nr:DoxX-like family protein [Evansella sp. AB-P1]MDG5786186.1 DoxX-like family protein [Evansella sp. AB-P1]